MAKKGRKRFADTRKEWKISIPESVAAKIELLLADPLTGKTKHGARSRLIVGLLQDWLKKRNKVEVEK